MRVHVICRATHTDRVLPRLANQLATAARWTMGDKPDPRADLNYFFPYLEWVDCGRDFDATRTVAWFTHRDTHAPGDKAALWDVAAAAVDLRLTTARQNLADLEQHGPARLVTPPVEDRFVPLPGQTSRFKQHPPTMPVVGVSGYVYPGGRKGEELVAQLVQERPDLHVVASGKGWPVDDCREWAWEEVHKFYQNLDVYLCTSLLEGIPMPPLEALACGVPVVVPRGVGLLDDLPDVLGVVRYDAGDFDGMVEALATVLNNACQREELSATVKPYSLTAWREDHERAFENLLWPALSDDESLSDWKDRSGIYCVAFGDPSRGMAEKLVASVARHMSDTPTCIVSDRSLGAGEGYFVERPDVDIGGRIAKVEMYQHAPADWRYILYLDADTEVVADVSVLFQFLADGWELVICKNPGKYHELGAMARPDNVEETNVTFQELGGRDWLQLNGGVMAFRRCARVERFFQLWLEEWHRWGKRDQAALHRALWRQPLRTLVLGNEWNTIIRYDDASITAGILHYATKARRWRGRVEGRLDSEEAWAAVTA